MIEHILRGHIAAGYFARQLATLPYGTVFPVEGAEALHGVHGSIAHPEGLHTRPTTQFVKRAKELGIDRAYVVAGDKYGHTGSILSLLPLGVRQGEHVTLVADHGEEPNKLVELYRVLTGTIQ